MRGKRILFNLAEMRSFQLRRVLGLQERVIYNILMTHKKSVGCSMVEHFIQNPLLSYTEEIRSILR